MYVDATDVGLSSHIMLDGYWEMWVTEVLVSRLRRGMTVIDVGANIGYFTMIMADLVGARGSVHAFEPNLAIAGLLAKSAHVNGFRERVTLHPEPLGDEEGRRVMLHVPENYPGGATIVPAPDNLQEDTLLSMRRLDSYEALLDADIIKIDAEGAEQAIWRGMSGLLARNRPMTIFIEFMLTRYEDPGAFIDEMLEYGFALHFVSAGIPLRPISRKEILAFPDDEDLMLVLIR
jgi:FkbM family methyltransferase